MTADSPPVVVVSSGSLPGWDALNVGYAGLAQR